MRCIKKIALCSSILFLSGCYNLGSHRLGRDIEQYSDSMIESNKQQTLLNLVRLRYADAPGMLNTTQVISGYQLQQSSFLGVASDTFPIRPNGGIAGQFQETPTFTFQPVTGDAYAYSFLRPLPPATLLPLAMGGLPIDILLRLSVQSVNMMSNNRPFSKNSDDLTAAANTQTTEFLELIHDLRVLQAAGLLSIQLEQDKASATDKTPPHSRVYLSLTATDDAHLLAIEQKVKKLLHFSSRSSRVEIVYGVGEAQPGEVRLLTRSMLSILGQVAYQIQIPDDEISSGSTRRNNTSQNEEDQSLIKVYSSHKRPHHDFVSVHYDDYYYWIDKRDFDSKLAFTMMQMLSELSKTTQNPGSVVTIPVNR
ncbi:hypothetical protein JK174_06230 [Acetobacter thailandicus]|nr:hypothetical protein [Acetobacter thailandicus]MBS0985082.1 hypothetical protein [Acetobacter thailandicus]